MFGGVTCSGVVTDDDVIFDLGSADSNSAATHATPNTYILCHHHGEGSSVANLNAPSFLRLTSVFKFKI